MRPFWFWLMLSGCGITGWWKGTSPVRQTCVVTSICHAQDAVTSDVSICAPKKSQEAEEDKLIALAMTELTP